MSIWGPVLAWNNDASHKHMQQNQMLKCEVLYGCLWSAPQVRPEKYLAIDFYIEGWQLVDSCIVNLILCTGYHTTAFVQFWI